jgi:signal transduction histidine kinase
MARRRVPGKAWVTGGVQDDGRKKPLTEEASVALYQMVRELLLNIAKHANAKKVRISVEKVLDEIRIIVADDGKGIDPSTGLRHVLRNGGFGLFNIRHRIEYLGGNLAIESEIGCGTRAILYLPLKSKESDGKIP